jgi:sulfite exporter TauE/SafE
VPLGADYNAMAMFLLGLAGTGHCLGMCGPLVVAVPGQVGLWCAHPVYHAGRLVTYTLTGACLGGIGGGLTHLASAGTGPVLIWTARLQVAVSALAALVLLLLGLHRMGFLREPPWLAAATPQKIPGVGSVLMRAMHHRSIPAVFLLGLMLGLLPCGLSYAAFARTLASGAMLTGAQWALAFGLGTLPGLLVLGTGAGAFLRHYRRQSEMVAGLLMIGMAVSLAVEIWTVFN